MAKKSYDPQFAGLGTNYSDRYGSSRVDMETYAVETKAASQSAGSYAFKQMKAAGRRASTPTQARNAMLALALRGRK